MEIKLRAANSPAILSLLNWARENFPELTDDLSRVIASAKLGVEVEINPLEEMRTRQQEKYYRKWCRHFADYCGMTPDEMHEEMLCTAYGSEEVQTKFGLRRRPVRRSSDAKRGDYSKLIDALIRISADMGFSVPPPSKYMVPDNSVIRK